MKFVTLSTGDGSLAPARLFSAAERAAAAPASEGAFALTRAGQAAAALGSQPTSTEILAAFGRAAFTWDLASDALH